MPHSNPNPTRILLWSLQRSGSSNLAHGLTKLMGHPPLQHEPFVKKDLYGPVVKQWAVDHAYQPLQDAAREICQKWPVLKHCPDTLPLAVSECLLEESVKQGFKHLFLYRQNETQRLLSLHFARITGIWGPSSEKSQKISEDSLEQPLPISNLISAQKNANHAMQTLWDQLIALKQNPVSICYEDIFSQPDHDLAAAKLHEVLSTLGVVREEAASMSFLKLLLLRGDQKTRHHYANFQEIEQLEQSLAAITPFQPVHANNP